MCFDFNQIKLLLYLILRRLLQDEQRLLLVIGCALVRSGYVGEHDIHGSNHVSICLVFFRAENATVTFWVSTVYVTFARCTIEPVFPNNNWVYVVDVNSDTLVEYVHFSVP